MILEVLVGAGLVVVGIVLGASIVLAATKKDKD